ncbi:CLUMA_CG002490, isoform A [Clunio marinus]|uniref:CLUMA_CG002490, isoform A n=1 Tax=Clunio marinus TaxID=568069 RepID=A0A1J1HRI6_9DIPT|nr:CLUMA_CG002490, isoform A [Clunio marinus]
MTNPNNLNTGMRCIKFIIFTISFMFGLTAFLLLAVGSTISTIFDDFSIFVDDHFFTPANLMVFIAICLLLVAATGCIGAAKESTMLVNIFALLLFIVFAMELTAAILAYMMHGQVEMMLIRTMDESFRMYDENEYIANGIDFMQQNLECCGIDSPDDWAKIIEAKGNQTSVPESCCHIMFVDQETGRNECEEFHQFGCLPRLNYIIEKSAMLIATGALTIAIVQFLGVVCAFMLAKTIRRTKSIREARRWQLQQSLGVLTNPFSFDKQMEANASGRQYDPDPEYTQMGNNNNTNTYLPNSPSVM